MSTRDSVPRLEQGRDNRLMTVKQKADDVRLLR